MTKDRTRQQTGTNWTVREEQQGNGKKHLLQSRSLACIVLVVVVVFGALFGTWRSLSRQRQACSEAFYVGTDNSGYGIATNLSLRVEYARNLCKIAADYDAAEETAAVESACVAVESADGFSEKYSANSALTDAVDTLDRRLAQLDLSDSDESYRKSLTADISSYEMRIDKLATDFNAQARNFNQDVLGGFPAGILGSITGVGEVEEYA